MEEVFYHIARKENHDISGIENPWLYTYRKDGGVWFPSKEIENRLELEQLFDDYCTDKLSDFGLENIQVSFVNSQIMIEFDGIDINTESIDIWFKRGLPDEFIVQPDLNINATFNGTDISYSIDNDIPEEVQNVLLSNVENFINAFIIKMQPVYNKIDVIDFDTDFPEEKQDLTPISLTTKWPDNYYTPSIGSKLVGNEVDDIYDMEYSNGEFLKITGIKGGVLVIAEDDNNNVLEFDANEFVENTTQADYETEVKPNYDEYDVFIIEKTYK